MKKVIDLILKENLFKGVKNVGVAVSGGVDSIALLHFLNNNKELFGINVVALHFDHKIRKTSAKDREFVQDFCVRYNIPFKFAEQEVLKYCKENKKGVEEGARELRYQFFNKCLEDKGVDIIALAHHKNDQAETILLNILRGAGIEGLTGMKIKNVKFVRPFLCVTKNEILKYAEFNNLTFVQDETNFDNDYSRNFLRNDVIPRLSNKFNSVDEILFRLAENCLIDNEFINSTIDFSCVEMNGNIVKISKDVLLKYHKSQNFRLIKYALSLINEEKDFSKIKFESMLNLLLSTNGSQISLKQNLVAINDYRYLTIEKMSTKNSSRFDAVTLNKKELNDSVIENFEFKIVNNLNDCVGAMHIMDYNKMPDVIQIRTRLNGDIFAKFGSGEKKLKAYLIDRKIPQRERDGLLLITNQNKVYCVLYYEISDSVKYDESTKKYLAIFNKKGS